MAQRVLLPPTLQQCAMLIVEYYIIILYHIRLVRDLSLRKILTQYYYPGLPGVDVGPEVEAAFLPPAVHIGLVRTLEHLRLPVQAKLWY